jgi:hypothetical protein
VAWPRERTSIRTSIALGGHIESGMLYAPCSSRKKEIAKNEKQAREEGKTSMRLVI